jgi:uncharacterized paraquat-inducible protein A
VRRTPFCIADYRNSLKLQTFRKESAPGKTPKTHQLGKLRHLKVTLQNEKQAGCPTCQTEIRKRDDLPRL